MGMGSRVGGVGGDCAGGGGKGSGRRRGRAGGAGKYDESACGGVADEGEGCGDVERGVRERDVAGARGDTVWWRNVLGRCVCHCGVKLVVYVKMSREEMMFLPLGRWLVESVDGLEEVWSLAVDLMIRWGEAAHRPGGVDLEFFGDEADVGAAVEREWGMEH